MGKYNKIIGGKRHDGECDTGGGIGSYNGCIYSYRGNNGRKLDKIFQSSEKASELSYSIMNIIYILAAMIIVVAIFTVVLYIYKFIMNRRDPNYKKNDDTFLDD